MADNDNIFNKEDTYPITEEERMRGRLKDIDNAIEDVDNCITVVIDELNDNESMVEELEGLISQLKKEGDEIYARLGS